jgi:Uma2 family endonuclease
MAITMPHRMTEEEFLRLPDNGRKYELVDGEPKEVPAGHTHDIYGANIIILLGPFARGRGFLAGSQAGFRMRNGNIRCPDVAFTLKSRLAGGRPSQGFENLAPDLCIEIISPSEEQEEMRRKVREYFGAEAQFVWHLFPDTETARVYTSPEDFTDYGPDDEIDGGELLPSFRSRVADLFALE